jgi:hypothetical protein
MKAKWKHMRAAIQFWPPGRADAAWSSDIINSAWAPCAALRTIPSSSESMQAAITRGLEGGAETAQLSDTIVFWGHTAASDGSWSWGSCRTT